MTCRTKPTTAAETGWLLQPPGPGEVQVNIEIGYNVELSPEARAALETLMHGLEEEEVAGFAFSLDAACGSYRICNPVQELPAPHQVADLLLVHPLSHRRHRLMRESRYNVWVERNGASYVYNGVGGGLLRMSQRRAGRGDAGPRATRRRATARRSCSSGWRSAACWSPTTPTRSALLEKRYAASRYDTSHFALTLVTSLGCNFDCPYCFEAKHPSIMSDAVTAAILDVLDGQLPRINNFDVTWFGGEPLVGQAAVARAVRRVHRAL